MQVVRPGICSARAKQCSLSVPRGHAVRPLCQTPSSLPPAAAPGSSVPPKGTEGNALAASLQPHCLPTALHWPQSPWGPCGRLQPSVLTGDTQRKLPVLQSLCPWPIGPCLACPAPFSPISPCHPRPYRPLHPHSVATAALAVCPATFRNAPFPSGLQDQNLPRWCPPGRPVPRHRSRPHSNILLSWPRHRACGGGAGCVCC